MVYNPIVYGLSHPHFRSSVRQYISGCTTVGHSHTAEHNFAATAPAAPGRGGSHRPAADKCGASHRFALLANRNRRRDNVVELKCVRHRRSTAVAAAVAAAATTVTTAAATATATARPDSISACLDYYSEPDCR